MLTGRMSAAPTRGSTSKALTVFKKELLDGIRERRSVLTALLFGPLMGPLLFGLLINFTINQRLDEADKPIEIPVVGGLEASNLLDYLSGSLIDPDHDTFTDVETLRQSVRDGDTKVGLVIDPEFEEALTSGAAAKVWVVADRSNNAASAAVTRLRSALRSYSGSIGAIRLQLRGIDPTISQPLAILDDDVSTPSGRSILLLSMMTYFLLFAALLGGTQVAIDTTAGERERGSLEPLLTMPVSREALVLGKVGATVLFMAVSLGIAVASFSVAVQILPLAKIGMTATLGGVVGLQIYLVMLPFTLLGAGVMTIVASFTKSFKEAQTYTSLAMLAPTLPIIVVAIKPVQATAGLMLIPSLSQHLLVTGLIKAEGIDPVHVLISVASTIVISGALIYATMLRYKSERLVV